MRIRSSITDKYFVTNPDGMSSTIRTYNTCGDKLLEFSVRKLEEDLVHAMFILRKRNVFLTFYFVREREDTRFRKV